jgi:hypothetical protein
VRAQPCRKSLVGRRYYGYNPFTANHVGITGSINGFQENSKIPFALHNLLGVSFQPIGYLIMFIRIGIARDENEQRQEQTKNRKKFYIDFVSHNFVNCYLMGISIISLKKISKKIECA